LRYDQEGFLFSLDRSDGISWTVISDQSGTPKALFDLSARHVRKEIRYTPLGDVLYDSNPSIFVPLGFRGGIQDPDTGLVHFHNRNALTSRLVAKITAGRLPINDEESSDKFYEGADYDP
jgi:hypothetical protein